MTNERFSIRLRAVKFFAFAVCVLFAASCSKERTISIPKRLTGSEWTMNGEAGIKVMKFLSDTECTLTEEPPQGEPRRSITITATTNPI